MPRSTKSADSTHGGKGRPITKASGSANVTPAINLNPSLADKAPRDFTAEGAPKGYPDNGPLLVDPAG